MTTFKRLRLAPIALTLTLAFACTAERARERVDLDEPDGGDSPSRPDARPRQDAPPSSSSPLDAGVDAPPRADTGAAPGPDAGAPDTASPTSPDMAPPTTPDMAPPPPAPTCPAPSTDGGVRADAGTGSDARAAGDAGTAGDGVTAGDAGTASDARAAGDGGAASAADPAQFGFEADIQGWKDQDVAQMSTFARATEPVFAGAGSLEVTLTTTKENENRYVIVDKAIPAINACAVLRFRVFVPTGSPFLGVQPFTFAQLDTFENKWIGTYVPEAQLKAGEWNTLTLQPPPNFLKAITLGVQFIVKTPGTYKANVDSIAW